MDAATNAEKQLARLGVVRYFNGNFITAVVKTSKFHEDIIFKKSGAVE